MYTFRKPLQFKPSKIWQPCSGVVTHIALLHRCDMSDRFVISVAVGASARLYGVVTNGGGNHALVV